MMNLGQWLKESGQTQQALALRLGINQGGVSRIVRGAVFPAPDTLEAIERITRGKVTAGDMLRHYRRARKAAMAE